jgi:hypothetical protein
MKFLHSLDDTQPVMVPRACHGVSTLRGAIARSQGLQLGEHLLNRVEIRTIGGGELQSCANDLAILCGPGHVGPVLLRRMQGLFCVKRNWPRVSHISVVLADTLCVSSSQVRNSSSVASGRAFTCSRIALYY